MSFPTRILAFGLGLATLATALPQGSVNNGLISDPLFPNGTAPGECTSEFRIAGAAQIVSGFNSNNEEEIITAFQRVPARDDLHMHISPDGSPMIPTAIDRTTFVDFAVAITQILSGATASYTDFNNGTTLLRTNITLGLLQSITVPVTLYADAYLTYDTSNCLMDDITAYLTVPTQIAGIPISPPILPQILSLSPLYKNGSLPI